MAQPITGRISSSAFAVLFWRAPSSTRRSGATRWLRSSTIKSLSSSTAAAAAAATTTTTQNAASRYSPATAPNTQQWQQSACFFPQSLTLTWRRFATSSNDGNIGNNSGKPKEQNEDNSTWLGTIKSKVQKTVGKKWRKGRWNDFLEEVALWLREEERRDDDDIVDTMAGLVKYGIKNEKYLISVAGKPPTSGELRKALKEEGILPAICDVLYEKYVTLPQQNGKYLYIPTVLELPDGHVQAGS